MPTPELYKDKVEVSLDGRQIFYLFFGGATIVGMVFVLGVLVGRRVEARGHVDHARTQTATDPLAALDRLEGSGGLSFQGSLTGKDAPSSVEKTIDDLQKTRAARPADKVKAEEPKKADEAKKDEAKKDEAKKDEAKAGPVVKPESDKKAEPKVEKKSEPKVEKKAEPKAADAEAKADKPDKKADAKLVDGDAKPEPKPEAESKTRYTLQLSSFQDKAEAEAFLSAMKGQGFTAQITQAEVEGKGTFYRVRMGTYRSLDAATSAKSELEKAGKSASIMKL